jgi:hypothetical protein
MKTKEEEGKTFEYDQMLRLHDMLISSDSHNVDFAFEILKTLGEGLYKKEVQLFFSVMTNFTYHTDDKFETKTDLNTLNIDEAGLLNVLKGDLLNFYVFAKFSKTLRIIKLQNPDHRFKIKLEYGQNS